MRIREQIDARCDEFELAWQSGETPMLEEFLSGVDDRGRGDLLYDLIAIELHYREACGESLSDESLMGLHPLLGSDLAQALRRLRISEQQTAAADAAARRSRAPVESAAQIIDPLAQDRRFRDLYISCPHCTSPVELVVDTPCDSATCGTCGSAFHLVDREEEGSVRPFRMLGRFELLSRLGMGAFGTVWKARDPELDRLVAVKVARPERLTDPHARHLYQQEARTLVKLEHVPGIPKVYDWGETDDESCYLVSEFIEGRDLKAELGERSFSPTEAALLVAQLADTLHEAHKQGLVHRDVKPANVLLRESGEPVIVDFGLALRDQEVHAGAILAGTTSYMSPEQAEMRSNAVDGRADIYALGVLLYEMLTGRLPLRGSDTATFLEQIKTVEPKPPRQHNDSVPPALEAVCLKALAKAPTERYLTARDFALALRQSVAERKSNRYPLLVTTVAVIAAFTTIWLRPNNVVGPLITEIAVQHWDRSGETPKFAGDIGDAFMPAFLSGDSARVRVNLAMPVYVTMYSLSPDGRITRLFPADNDQRTTLHDSVVFPTDPRDLWTVNEGLGMQAFLVLASARPPEGLDGTEEQIAARWRQVAERATVSTRSIYADDEFGPQSQMGRWFFDGTNFERLPDFGTSRSLESGAFGDPPQDFVALCKLPQLNEQFDVRAILFEVLPQP